MVWILDIPQKLMCETKQESSEVKWLSYENINLISVSIPDMDYLGDTCI